MGKEKRRLRDGTGPYSGGIGRRRREQAVCPFDKESKEDIRNMKIRVEMKGQVKIVNDELGKGRFIK